jgi:NAD(P)-dependent dehydrogenase (short-subunit alcohol dehydrogenase family)
MADIFISYAREDREIARALAQALADQGWSVWWDRNIPIGRRFHDVIQRELTATRCVIALWSAAALGSPWVREEAQDGLDRNILAPAKIGIVQLPIGFRTVQTADLSDWNGNPAHPSLIQLVEHIRSVLGGASPREQDEARRADEAEAAPKNGASGRHWLKWMTAAGLAVLVGFAGVMAWQQWPTREQPGPVETTRKDQKITPPPDTPSPSITEPINLLAPENGGKVLKASNTSWLNTVDGDDKSYGTLYLGEEAVYAFKDEKPATFNAFAVLILGTAETNLNEFALFYSNDPIGPFTQIRKFQTENILYLAKPYQTFSFPTVTAKYLKVRIISSYSHVFNYVYVHEFQLLGNFST